MTNKIIHFEVPAQDVEKLQKFYSEVFEWTFNKWDGPEKYWLVMTGDKEKSGIDGGMMIRQMDEQPVVNTIDVQNIDEAIKKIEISGGQIIIPKKAVPGVGWMAYFKDPEGKNIFGIMQSDESAK